MGANRIFLRDDRERSAAPSSAPGPNVLPPKGVVAGPGGTPPAGSFALPPGGKPAIPVPNSPGGPGANVAAFDRPQAVVIMGPRPIPVTIVGRTGAGAALGPRGRKAQPSRRLTKAARAIGVGAAAIAAGGAATASIFHNQVMPSFATAVSVATAGLSIMGPKGQVAAAGLAAVAATANAVKSVFESISARAQELRGFSGSIAAAAARLDVSRIQGDIREAQLLSQQYAKFLENQEKLERTIRELLLPIKMAVLDAINKGPQFIKENIDGLAKSIAFVLDPRGLLPALPKVIAGGIGLFLDNAQKDPTEDLLKPLIESMRGIAAPSAIGENFPHGPLGVPIVGSVLNP